MRRVACKLSLLHQPPGFAILLVAAAVGGSRWIDVDAPVGREGSYREHEPSVLGHDICDQKVNLFRGVRDLLPVPGSLRVHEIPAPAEVAGGLHLHLPELLSGAQDEIVAVALSVRLGYFKAQALGL